MERIYCLIPPIINYIVFALSVKQPLISFVNIIYFNPKYYNYIPDVI